MIVNTVIQKLSKHITVHYYMIRVECTEQGAIIMVNQSLPYCTRYVSLCIASTDGVHPLKAARSPNGLGMSPRDDPIHHSREKCLNQTTGDADVLAHVPEGAHQRARCSVGRSLWETVCSAFINSGRFWQAPVSRSEAIPCSCLLPSQSGRPSDGCGALTVLRSY